MLFILECESNWNPRAFNPEIGAKAKGLTRYSSCGLYQINSAECEKDESPLYDIEYNIAQAYQKYKSQGLGAWRNCLNKIK